MKETEHNGGKRRQVLIWLKAFFVTWRTGTSSNNPQESLKQANITYGVGRWGKRV